ncbi:hypothetical protein K7G19_07195 [Cupriavidus sp. DB3]|uniref:hypothetical protein n=1 Tax=Cupriavidus sp. DB3 TaxID=2873259 RepID=UPI001CF5F402|nr:hypothetical protein [Cupriavidus sp. DB3]MCA7083384.1 hypothetical protein [Cupriavidus sp. DB3]
MKKLVLLVSLLSPLASQAALTDEQGQALMEQLISSSRTCSKAKIDDRQGRLACEQAQNLEKQLFAGGWCYSPETRRYATCDPGYKDFLDDVFARRKTAHREVIWAYPLSPVAISELLPLSSFPVRFYPERPCRLPLANATNMRHVEQAVGSSTYQGCYWRILGNKIGTVILVGGTPNYDTFHDSSVVVTKLGKNGTHVMVVDRLMTLEQIRTSISRD